MEVNEPEIDTTTQNTSSAKENGQRKRGDEDESEVGSSTITWEEPDAQSTPQMERFRESLKNMCPTPHCMLGNPNVDVLVRNYSQVAALCTHFNESPEANGNSKKPDEIDIQEAESQWELAKSIRVHTELQQPAVISKITEMEIRDK
ncbi:hypothetical protein JHK86_043369 [Glycine max]|nr:hypothetical protein JHK86_043369 [Glycine max]